MYKCKCCGHETLPVPPEDAVAYICPICRWENDVFTADDNEPSDENHGLTLRQAQKNYQGYGICDPRLQEKTGRALASVIKEDRGTENTASSVQNQIIGGNYRYKPTADKTESGESK